MYSRSFIVAVAFVILSTVFSLFQNAERNQTVLVKEVHFSGDLGESVDELRQCTEFLTGHVLDVAVSGDGQHAISACEYCTLKVWDLDAGRELHTLQGRTNAVHGVAVSEDGRRAISASRDKTLKVWDVEAGLELRTLEGHTGSIGGVAVSANGRRALAASLHNTLHVWDLETGALIATFYVRCRSSLLHIHRLRPIHSRRRRRPAPFPPSRTTEKQRLNVANFGTLVSGKERPRRAQIRRTGGTVTS